MRRLATLVSLDISLVGAFGAACQNTNGPDPDPELPKPKIEVSAQADVDTARAKPQPGSTTPQEQRTAPVGYAIEHLGSARMAPGLQRSVSRVIAVADSNTDGKVSREEATSALNFVVGGFFFRADADGDGKITVAERRQARDDLAKRHREFHQILTTFASSKPIEKLMTTLDADVDQTIDLAQTRSAIRGVVDGIYEAVDLNSDDIITLAEADRGFNVGASALGRAAFRQGDADGNGKITLEEFQSSLDPPLKRAFEVADANDDGSLTDEEAASVMWWLTERVDSIAEHGYEALSHITEGSVIRKAK
jgi:Ca2+-binding EF-hand superfamily protein